MDHFSKLVEVVDDKLKKIKISDNAEGVAAENKVAAETEILVKGVECETKTELEEDFTEAVIHSDDNKIMEKASLDQSKLNQLLRKQEKSNY